MGRFLLAFICLVLCAVCMAIASPVGTWSGKYVFDSSKVKLPSDPQQKAVALQAVEALKNTKFTFILRADKTFRMEIQSVQGGKSRLQITEGTYKVANNKVTTLTLKREGKKVPVSDRTQNTLVMSADGKSMVHTKTDPMVHGRLELKRASK